MEYFSPRALVSIHAHAHLMTNQKINISRLESFAASLRCVGCDPLCQNVKIPC
jgi:hypothetical protein